MQGDAAMITKDQLRELKLAELMRIKDEIDNVIQERAKSSGMVLTSIAAHTSTGYIRAAVKSRNDDNSEAWPFG
jgi:hypothetical protein